MACQLQMRLLVVSIIAFAAAVVVRFGSEYGEVLVETHLHLAPVRQPDLDLVRGAVVAGFRLGGRPAAEIRKRRRYGPVLRRSAQWLVIVATGRHGDARRAERDQGATGRCREDDLRPSGHD